MRKKSQSNRSVAKLGLAEDALCYVSLEQNILHQLQQSHTENQLIHTLKDAVYPELNLKSYLDCKSDLALPTIRRILRGRPTEEALELDRSLTKALIGQRKSPIKKTVPVTNSLSAAVPRNQGFPHPWLLPMEWED